MKLAQAQTIAQALLEQMTPYCERIAIAGSIRRGKEDVKDIEIVTIPKWEMMPDPADLFGHEVNTNLLHQWAMSEGRDQWWIKTGTSAIEHIAPNAEGKYWRAWLAGPKVDLFLCTPQNWGYIYLLRTGSADFSQAIVTHANRVGKHFRDGRLLIAGVPVETREESNVFDLLDLEWIEPSARIDGNSLYKVVSR